MRQKPVYVVEGEPFHHMVRVMRMVRMIVYLVFQDQVAILAKIQQIDEQAVHLIEVEKEQQDKELPIHVTIASGYPKGDKLELIVKRDRIGCR